MINNLIVLFIFLSIKFALILHVNTRNITGDEMKHRLHISNMSLLICVDV